MSLNEESLQTRGELCSINTHMIPSKLIYLLSLGLSGCYVPYLNLFLRSIGLTTTQAGFISGIRFLSAPVSTTLFGTIADSTGRRKLIFLVLCLGSYLPIFSMPWVAQALKVPSKNISTIQNNSMINGTELYSDYEAVSYETCTLFYTMLAIMIFAGFFSVPLAGFIDSAVINVIKTAKQKTNFGAQRMVGSISFGLANFIAGVAAENYRHPTLSRYTAIFYVFLPLVFFIIPVGYVLLGQCKWQTDTEVENKKCDSVGKHVLHFFTKMEAIFFIITVLVSGVAYNTFYGFLFLFMRDDLNASSSTMTLAIVTTSIAEIVTFPFTSKIIKFIGSAHLAIIIGIFSYFIRFVYMSYATTACMIIPIQIIHGIGFSLSWTAQVEYTHEIAPKNIAVTAFSIVASLHFAVGAIIANVLGGDLYDIIGGRTLFCGIGLICGVWSIIILIYYIYNNFKSKVEICGLCRRDSVRSAVSENGETKLMTTSTNVTITEKQSCMGCLNSDSTVIDV